MNVAIIGTGNVGSALGGSFSRAGHDVTFYGRDAAKTAKVAKSTSSSAAGSAASAVQDADVVVVAVPYGAVADIVREIAPAVDGKVVIDATNPLRADMTGLATTSGESAAEEIAHELGHAHVAKAFNTVFAGIQGDPGSGADKPDALFAADDEEARNVVAQLAESIGFRPVYVGPLAAARELEALAFLNIRLQIVNGGAWNTSIKLVDAPDRALAA